MCNCYIYILSWQCSGRAQSDLLTVLLEYLTVLLKYHDLFQSPSSKAQQTIGRAGPC